MSAIHAGLFRMPRLTVVRAAFFLLLTGSVPAPAATNYVWIGGSHTPPYHSWTNAARDVETAVNYAKTNYPAYDTVLVTNDTYAIAAEIVLNTNIMLRGFSGNPADVIVSRAGPANYRIVRLSHSAAVVEGLTLSGGYATSDGGGVYMTAGAVRHCLVVSNRVVSAGLGRGGGVFMTGGLLTNCVIRNNRLNPADNNHPYGGGVYAGGGAVRACRIEGNRSEGSWGYFGVYGGGIYMTGSGVEVANCLIVSNTIARYNYEGAAGHRVEHGAGVFMDGGRLLHCTVATNTAQRGSIEMGGAAGGVYQSGGAVSNCIVYFNTAAGSANDFYTYGGVRYYTCAPELTTGPGNLTGDPGFVDVEAGNYRLRADSICIDAGTNLAEVTTDLEGNGRPLDGNGDGGPVSDMGCYEFAPGAELTCNFLSSARYGLNLLDVTFTATVAGPVGETNIAHYWWDFGNGTENGASLSTVTRGFAPGRYTVALTVSNTLGQVTNAVKSDFIRVLSENAYVSTNAAGQYPYDTWEKATDDPHEALSALIEATYHAGAAAADLWVSNGVYNLSGELGVIQAIRMRGVNGAGETTLRRPGPAEFRILSLTHTDALVEGFTIANGRNPIKGVNNGGGGVYMSRGTLRDCVIADNRRDTTLCPNGDPSRGGGVIMWGGLMTNCVIRNNIAVADYWNMPYGGGVYVYNGWIVDCSIVMNTVSGSGGYGDAYGGGVYASGATIRDCRILTNVATAHSSASQGEALGGGVYMTGATQIRNSLIATNTVRRRSTGTCHERGGGVWMDNGSLASCTLSDNVGVLGSSTAGGYSGGGVYRAGGSITNCVIWFNTSAGAANNYYGSQTVISYSCAPELTTGTAQTNLNADPLFENRAVGDYRLRYKPVISPCINAGLDQEWMLGGATVSGFSLIGKPIAPCGRQAGRHGRAWGSTDGWPHSE